MADQRCAICRQTPLTTQAEQIMTACRQCAVEVGIVPMPPARRPSRPCAHCNSLKFVRVIPREHSVVPSGDRNRQQSAPMYLTHAPTATAGWFDSKADPLAIQQGFGMVEAYVCRKCGVIEWYCADAERIPASPILMSEDVDYEGETPYR